MRILVVEDEPDLADAVAASLRASGHAIDVAGCLGDAAAAVAGTDYDLVLLDLRLPDGDGLDLLRGLRAAHRRTPVLVGTARDRIVERVAGLQAGADDYLVKPYDLAELHARVDAIHRRASASGEVERRFGRLTIVPERRRAVLDGAALSLTLREWALLERLSRRPDAIVSRAQIEEALYGFGDEVESNAVQVHVSRLRAKLGRGVVVTERGLGYRMGRV